MNKLSMAAFQAEAQVKNQEKLVSDLVAKWSKKNGKVARASGVSLMALTLAACGGEDNTPYGQADIDAALAPVQAALADAQDAAAVAKEAQETAEAAQETAEAAAQAAATAQAEAEADAEAAATAQAEAEADAEAAATAQAEAEADAEAAEAALATAQSNLTTALASQSTAEAARDAAQTAKDAAEARADEAEEAQEAAEAAQATAESARDAAVTAKEEAEAAQVVAEAARDAAVTAKEEAEAAQAVAEAAEEVAEAALAVATGELSDIREALGLGADASAADIVAAIEAKDVQIASLEDSASGTVTASAASVDEGGAVTFTIAGEANTSYVVDIAGGTATVDYAGAAQRVVTTDADGNATLTITTIADETTEGAETLTVTVNGLTGATASVTVNDTSTTPANSAPVISNVSTATIADNDDAILLANAEDAEVAVTVSDADGNFAGGSIAVAIDGAYLAEGTGAFTTALDAIDETAEGGFAYSIASDIINATDAEGNISSVATFATTTAEVGENTEITGFQVTLLAGATAAHVTDMMEALSMDNATDAEGNDLAANVTVTVTDGAGASDSYTVTVDSTGSALSIDDTTAPAGAEIELAETSGENTFSLNFEGTAGAFDVDGATLAISATAGTTITADTGEYTVVSGNLLDAAGNDIGDITGNGTNSVSVTLDAEADFADVVNFLDTMDMAQEAIGATTIAVTLTQGDGLVSFSDSSTVTVVGEFTDATDAEGADLLGAESGTGITLQDLLEATAEAPVTLSGNTYVSINGEMTAADTDDIDTLIAEGALVVTDSNIVRLEVTGENADISGVGNISSLGTTVTVSSVDAEGSLSMSASQHAEVGAIVAEGDITITDGQNGLSSDYSNITGEGAVSVVIDTADAEDDGEVADLDLTLSGDLGEAVLTLEGEGSLTATAAILDGVTTAEGEDTSADITVSDPSNLDGVDLSGISAEDIGDLNVAFSENATITDGETNLGEATLSVGVGATLTSTLEILDGKTVTVADAVGTGGTSGGVTVNASGELGEAYDLSGITYETDGTAAGSISGTAAGIVVNITADAALADGASITVDAEDAAVNVNSGATLTVANASDINDDVITGEGAIAAALNAEDSDLSNISVSTMTASVAATATLNANSDLGEFDVTVDDGAVLTLTSAQASGVTITSDDADAETAAEAAGSVTVTLSGATGETADDYSGISLGGAYAEGEGTAGVFTIAAEGDNDVTGMTLGDFTSMTINGEGTITMTSAQANGASVAAAEAGENASIVVSGILADVDLGEVSPDGEGTLTATTTGSVDLTGATLGDLSSITVDDGDGETDTDHTMTLTGLQAAALSTNTAGEAADAEDATDAEGPDVALGVDITGLDAEDSFSLTIEASTAVDGEGVALDAAETGLTIGGSSSADTITGTQAADSIVGNAGADIISGGTGADVIVGGTGRDTMTGGEGADQFWFVSAEDSGVGGANRDIIADFAEAGIAGGDNINLSLLNGDAENAGEGTLEFIGTNSFTGTGGAAADTVEVRYTVLSGNAIVEIDFDGDGGTDMQIQVNEVDTLVAADFTLA